MRQGFKTGVVCFAGKPAPTRIALVLVGAGLLAKRRRRS
ncbi:PEP-CTERM sorting domain-containing protein [Pseudomonas sichuanensis]